jgi:hypothetical protein
VKAQLGRAICRPTAAGGGGEGGGGGGRGEGFQQPLNLALYVVGASSGEAAKNGFSLHFNEDSLTKMNENAAIAQRSDDDADDDHKPVQSAAEAEKPDAGLHVHEESLGQMLAIAQRSDDDAFDKKTPVQGGSGRRLATADQSEPTTGVIIGLQQQSGSMFLIPSTSVDSERMRLLTTLKVKVSNFGTLGLADIACYLCAASIRIGTAAGTFILPSQSCGHQVVVYVRGLAITQNAHTTAGAIGVYIINSMNVGNYRFIIKDEKTGRDLPVVLLTGTMLPGVSSNYRAIVLGARVYGRTTTAGAAPSFTRGGRLQPQLLAAFRLEREEDRSGLTNGAIKP